MAARGAAERYATPVAVAADTLARPSTYIRAFGVADRAPVPQGVPADDYAHLTYPTFFGEHTAIKFGPW